MLDNKKALIEYIIQFGQNESWKELARKFNLKTAEVARHTWRSHKRSIEIIQENPSSLPEEEVVTLKENLNTGRAEIIFNGKEDIRDLDELIKRAKIDTEKWAIDEYFHSESAGGKTQIKIWLSPKKKEELKSVEEVLSSYTSKYVPLTKSQILQNANFSEPSLAVLALSDFHIDKKTIDNQPIEDYIDAYKKVSDTLLYKAYHSSKIDELIFIVGNDFFNTDNIHNATTNLTPQQVSVSWDEAYELGFDLLVDRISKAKQFCNTLTVLFVPGNHDRTKSYYLAHALEVFFRGDSSIKFIRNSDNRKVYTYGENMLCFHHGDCKNEKLPMVFATEYYKEWGMCKHKEILVADKHHTKEQQFKFHRNEVNGVRMRILPSLSSSDKWHNDKLFTGSRQSGLCLIYDKTKGKVAEFEESI